MLIKSNGRTSESRDGAAERLAGKVKGGFFSLNKLIKLRWKNHI